VSASTPASGSSLLDTNIVIALFAREAAVMQRLAQMAAVFVPGTVIGELYFGAYNSARLEQNVARVAEFAATASVLWADPATAQRYGQLKADLRALGRPLPENDIWIAALAHQYSLVVVTRDAHFHSVPGLAVETW
jgi:tRNA(fMet)-specific endonuclease VapC